MGLFGWILYIVFGIITFFIISFMENKYSLTKLHKLIFSNICMIIIAGVLCEFGGYYTDNIFLLFVFMMITDVFYSNYFAGRDFFDREEKKIYYYILLIISGFIINQEFINRVNQVFMTGEDLRLILWFLIIIFLYKFMVNNNILGESLKNNNKKMSVDSVLVSFAKLKHKFYDECLYDNKDISNMVYTIMIYENNRRSKLVRNIDNFKFKINGEKRRLGIMQVESKKFITDSESIEIVHKKINKLYDKAKSSKNNDISSFVFDSYSKNDSESLKYIYDIVCKF